MAFQNGLGAGERVARRIPDRAHPDRDRRGVRLVDPRAGARAPRGNATDPDRRDARRPDRAGSSAIERAWRDAGFNVRAFDDVTLMIWEKFLCNVTLSAPCAAFDVTVGDLMANPEAWRVALGCTSEAYRLGLAQGIRFTFDDPLRYVTEFAATIPNTSPSMRLDHLARRPSEIDVINGQVVDAEPRARAGGAVQRDPVRHPAPARVAVPQIAGRPGGRPHPRTRFPRWPHERIPHAVPTRPGRPAAGCPQSDAQRHRHHGATGRSPTTANCSRWIVHPPECWPHSTS